MNLSQHKLAERICPGCNELKRYPARHQCCSNACAVAVRMSGKPAEDAPASVKQSLGETHEHNGDSWTVTLPQTPIHTLEALLEYCQADMDVWEVERWVCNRWEVGAKDNEGKINVAPLYQVKAWLRRNRAVAVAKDITAQLIEQAKRYAPKPIAIIRSRVPSGNLLSLDIPDLHLGKLAWSKETGYADYDLNIAQETFRQARTVLLERSAHYRFDEIVIPCGNDFFNSDNTAGTTTRGTPQDNDSRYPKVLLAGHNLIVETVEILRQIAPVRLLMVRGNHDDLTTFHLGHSLHCWFHRHSDVEVNFAPLERKYLEFGSNLIGWTHGDKSKPKDYLGIVSSEVPQAWGRTKYREINCAHVHHEQVKEYNGFIVRYSPSLAGTDAYHSRYGYVGARRRATATVYQKDEGPIAQVSYTVPDHPEQDRPTPAVAGRRAA